MLRANSLKKALRQIIEQAEKGKRKGAPLKAKKQLYHVLLLCPNFSCTKITGDVVSVVDEQNRHTQVQRMFSSSSIKRENSEELTDAEPRKGAFILKSEGIRGEGTCSGTFWKNDQHFKVLLAAFCQKRAVVFNSSPEVFIFYCLKEALKTLS